MSRSGGDRSRWFGGRAKAGRGPERSRASVPPPEPAGSAEQRPGPPLLTEEYGTLVLLRAAHDTTISQTTVHELADLLGTEAGVTTVVTGVVGSDGAPDGEFWQRLSELFDTLRATGTHTVRLVMSGAGEERPDRPSVARRVADAWELEVIAPDGEIQLVPGGSLFVRPEPPRVRGWWSFTPGVRPVALGTRQPPPAWQHGVEQVPERTDSGCVIHQIPAGLLARSPYATEPVRGDLCYSVPVDPRGPTVLVGVPEGGDVSASDVGEVLSALPAALRPRVRLAPGSPRDILRTGQQAAERLGTEVVVYTGMPLLTPTTPAQHATVQAVVIGPDGAPRWRPFVDAVVCAPAVEGEPAPAPRLLRWRAPVPGRGNAERGAVRLSDRWWATVTRAGLWITGGGEPDAEALTPAPAAREVDAGGPAIEVGRSGEPLDASLWPELARLLSGLGADVAGKARLYVHGTAVDGGQALRALAAQHGVRTLRFTPRPARAARDAGEPAPAPQPFAGAFPTTGAPLPTSGGPTVPRGHGPGRTAAGAGSAATAAAGAAAIRPPAPTSRPDGAAPGEARTRAPEQGRSTPEGPRAPRGPGAPQPPGTEARGPRPTAERPAGRTRFAELLGLGEDEEAPVEPKPKREPEPEPKREPEPEPKREPEPDVSAEAGPEAPPQAPTVPPRPTAEAGPDGRTADATGGDGTADEGDAPDPVRPPRAVPTASAAPETTAPLPAAVTAEPTPALPVTPTTPAVPARPTTPAVPVEPASRTAPAATATPIGPLPPVPFRPGHVSTPAERAAFRVLADTAWDRHGLAVSRTLTRLPALRGQEQEAARADLIALRLCLQTSEGPLSHEALARGLFEGEERLLPYAACVTSGLRRMPSYRGLAFRGAGGGEPGGVLEPGVLLRDPAPVCVLPAGADVPRPGGAQYAVWSVTGRRVRQLADRPGSDRARSEVVFPPGTLLKVLDVREEGGSPLTLLREVPLAGPDLPARHGGAELDADDVAALARLDEALRDHPVTPGRHDWPWPCAGSLERTACRPPSD